MRRQGFLLAITITAIFVAFVLLPIRLARAAELDTILPSLDGTPAKGGSCIPPASVDIDGPTSVLPETPYTFTATVEPTTTTTPINFLWGSTDAYDSEFATVDGIRHSTVISWPALPGTHTLSVSITTDCQSFSWVFASHTVNMLFAPGGVSIVGPFTGTPETPYSFSALSLPRATTPITYTWQATEHAPVTRAARGVSDVLTYTWTTTGTKHLTVTAANVVGTATGTYSLPIDTCFANEIPFPIIINPPGGIDPIVIRPSDCDRHLYLPLIVR